MCIIIVVSSNLAGRKQCNQGPYKKNRTISQTDAKRRFKQKPYLSCNLRFSTRTIIFLSIYLQKNSNDVAFSPLRWVRRRPSLPLSRFVMPYVLECYAVAIAIKQL